MFGIRIGNIIAIAFLEPGMELEGEFPPVSNPYLFGVLRCEEMVGPGNAPEKTAVIIVFSVQAVNY